MSHYRRACTTVLSSTENKVSKDLKNLVARNTETSFHLSCASFYLSDNFMLPLSFNSKHMLGFLNYHTICLPAFYK